MKFLSKQELYELVVSALGGVVDIPPIEYCMFQGGETYQVLGFNWGSTFVKYQRTAKLCSVVIEDEGARPQFLTVSDFRKVLS